MNPYQKFVNDLVFSHPSRSKSEIHGIAFGALEHKEDFDSDLLRDAIEDAYKLF